VNISGPAVVSLDHLTAAGGSRGARVERNEEPSLSEACSSNGFFVCAPQNERVSTAAVGDSLKSNRFPARVSAQLDQSITLH
jgi:hypothetical protein